MRTLTGLLILALAGCQTMSTKAESVGKDGSYQNLKQTCIVPPFGKLAEGSGTMTTSNGPQGYTVATGQAAKGVDNSAQAQVVSGIVEGIVKAVMAYIALPPVAPKPTFLEQLSPELFKFTPPVTVSPVTP